mgnify:FL=1
MNQIAAIQTLIVDVGDDIACRHYYEPKTGLSFDLLARIGVLRPINQHVLPCSTHGCPLCGSCPYEADFSTRNGPPRSNRKFRLAPAARSVGDDGLVELACDHPLYELVMKRLADGSATVFDLGAQLLAVAEDELRGNGQERKSSSRRAELGAYLRLRAGLGLIELDPDGVHVRLPGVGERREVAD